MALSKEETNLINAIFSNMDRHLLSPLVSEAEKQVSIHFEYGYYPGEILDAYRPNEPSQAKEYRIQSYEQTTYPLIKKVTGLLKGALSNPQLLVIEYPQEQRIDETGQGIRNYVSIAMPKGIQNLDRYFWEFIFPKSVAYPNSFVAVVPAIPDSEIQDKTQYRRPYPEFIPSSNVINYSDDHVLILSTEKSIYIENKKEKEGDIYFIFLPFLTVQARQTGKDTFEFIEYHRHAYPRPLCRQIGGEASGMVQNVLESSPQSLYLSHIQGMIPNLNKVLRETSDFDAATVRFMHPVRTESLIECPGCGGKGDQTCNTCHGSHYIAPSSTPLESIVVDPGEDGKISEAVLFTSPDTGIFDAAAAKIDAEILKAYQAADMEILYEGTGARQTAEAKKLDRENLYNRMEQVGKTAYPLYQWILDTIIVSRYVPILGSTAVDVLEEYRAVVNSPNNFDVSGFNEEVDRLTKLMEGGVDASTRTLLVKRVANKSLGPGTEAANMAIAYQNINPYAGYTADQVLSLSLVGDPLDPEKKVRDYIYLNLTGIVDKLVEMDNTFLSWSSVEQREAAVILAGTLVNQSVNDAS